MNLRSVFNSSFFAVAVVATAALTSISAKAEVVASCENTRNSIQTIESRDLEKCHDIEAQKGPLFLGQGSSAAAFAPCGAASADAEASSLNSCRDYAVKNGLNPRGCTQITKFKTSDSLYCQYTSYHYLKSSETAFIAFTLDRTTQTKLFEEAQKRSMSVRDLIAEKLQK